MDTQAQWIIDSDVFITAKNRYYAFDICPGFWDSLIVGCRTGCLRSIDKVRQELFNWSEEELVRWVKDDLPAAFFVETSDPAVVKAFGEVMLWVQRRPQYFDHAKAAFATKADGWLVAHAMVYGSRVATNEQAAPDSRKEVKLGDVCEAFGVTYADTFAMLRSLKVRYDYVGRG